MKAEQITQALLQKFRDEDARIVFWRDENAEFQDYMSGGLPEELADVAVVDVSHGGALSAKIRIESAEPDERFLVYRGGASPSPEADWLLDVRCYSAELHADMASVWLQELGLAGLRMRDHLRLREMFLKNQERRRKLAKHLVPDDTEAAIDRKMLAVLANSETDTAFAILCAVCHGHLECGRFDLAASPPAIDAMEKMGLATVFWDLMARAFGYAVANPSISGLLRGLFISDLFRQLQGSRLDQVAHFELPRAGRQNAVVCLTHWRDSASLAVSYDAIGAALAEELKLRELLESLDDDTSAGVFTFWDAERIALNRLRKRVLDEAHALDAASVEAAAAARQRGYWLSGPTRQCPERVVARRAYDAIVAAARLFVLRNTHKGTFSFTDASAALDMYCSDGYRYDRHYREFCAACAEATLPGWEPLRALAEEVERAYDQAFLAPFGREWTRLLDAGFLQSWCLPDRPMQHNFFRDQIRPVLQESEKRKAYVIISDALRFEAAHELVESMNGKYRMRAELDWMLGVLPSYTALGMASLLPHKELAYADKEIVEADGKSTQGAENRGKILAAVEGIALRARDLTSIGRDEARDLVQGARVVYVYHDVIDSRGDTAGTEGEVFAAVQDCLEELIRLVQFCVNTLNAGSVWVTADHGFLFQREAPGETDRTELAVKPSNAYLTKKRYVIGPNLGPIANAHHGRTSVTAGTTCETEFWVPRGTSRFHFVGGARFVHGGAMPQEIVVPVVRVAHVRGRSAEATRIDYVGIQILGGNHKITTPKHRFEFIQTVKVSERSRARAVRAAIYEGARPVTSVALVTFDSTSDSLDERKRTVVLELGAGEYDKNTAYRLVLRDAETDAEVQYAPVVIDRSFSDDF